MVSVAVATLGVVVALVVGIAIGRRGRPTPPRSDLVVPDRAPAPPSLDEVGTTLRTAVNHLEIGVVVASPSGRIVYRNDAADAFRGTHVGVILDGHVEDILARARRGERVDETVELRGPPKLSVALVAESMPDGAAVATIQDVSERVRIDAMRTDFVSNISHELKTPVGAIAVLAEALVEEPDPEVVARVAERMVGEAHRAARAIDDLLELSRIESTHRTDEIVDLGSIVQASISRGRVLDAPHDVRVTAFDTAPPVRLRVDGRQLVSAIGNLVENAVKYSYAHGVVQVRTRIDEHWVEIMVADQGIGIPARDLDRIFERFYRVDKARSRTTGGTGLGLAIVRHVATNHGGEVIVSSTEGEGSTFVFRVPASLVVGRPPGDVDRDVDRDGAGDGDGATAAAVTTSDRASARVEEESSS
jgi:two-component system sensor histidine kinase SenX3